MCECVSVCECECVSASNAAEALQRKPLQSFQISLTDPATSAKKEGLYAVCVCAVCVCVCVCVLCDLCVLRCVL